MSGGWGGAGRTAWLAAGLLAAGWATSASAADLGGDCCADLEERIAELEATTARKGNRKVSLEISGHVNEGLLWWDDGIESNAGLYTNDNQRTRFRFKGKAKIDKDWEAGYQIEIGLRTQNSKRFTQISPSGGDNPADLGLDIRDSYWYIKSKTYGGVSLGTQATATDAITEANLTQTSVFSKYSDVEDSGLGLLLRRKGDGLTNSSITPVGSLTSAPGESGLTWRRLIGDGGDQPGEGERRYQVVKYETSTLAGFTASASWGQDDFWDVGLRYNGEFSGFKIAAGIGYGEQRDGFYLDTKTVCAGRSDAVAGQPSLDQQCNQFGGSVSVLHEESGLFVNVGAGFKHDLLIEQTARFVGTGVDPDQDFWAIQAGIEKKWLPVGKTTIYGEYYDYNGGGNVRRTIDGPDGGVADALNPFAAGGDSAIWSTGVQSYGLGAAQGIDAAALTLYVSYRHYEADLQVRQLVGTNAAGAIADVPLEDLDVVFSGGIIKF